MNIGMLWFDNDPKTNLEGKVERAAAYYRTKYGHAPNICYVHPSMLQVDPSKAGAVEVRSNKSVLPNHFWIGVNGKHSGPANA